MEPKEHYTGKDFTRYALKKFPKDFAYFRKVYKCNLEHKTCFDKNHTAHDIKALFVGHYHTREGGPPVWAQATTTGVRYFSGKSIETICVPIPERHVSRIYNAVPYNTVLGAQDGGSRAAGMKAGHYFVETIINVLFLLAGQIKQISNPSQPDMLGTSKYVCINSVYKPEVQEVSHVPIYRRSEISLPQNALDRQNEKQAMGEPEETPETCTRESRPYD